MNSGNIKNFLQIELLKLYELQERRKLVCGKIRKGRSAHNHDFYHKKMNTPIPII